MTTKKTTKPKLTKKQARDALWRLGDLSWKLHGGQREMQRAFHASKGRKFVINCSRRFGKSYYLCAEAISTAIRNPDSQIKYAAPTQKQVRKIILPNIRRILNDCPQDLLPTWHAQESRYEFPNGSIIDVAGTEMQNIENLRGTEALLIIIDEAGQCGDLNYAVRDVLMPMLLTTGGRMLLASTPPPTPRHPFEIYAQEAQKDKAYIHKTIYDNPMIDRKTLHEFMKESGGAQTTTWKREYLGEFIVDDEIIVLPEFKESEAKVIQAHNRPDHFDCYVSLDPGYRDLTVALFGYYDFQQAKIIVEDEFVQDKVRTDIVAEAIKQKELELWGDKKPLLRVCDADPILVRDLSDLHDLQFTITRRDEKQAQINELRMLIQTGAVKIHPRCKTLINHCRAAVWDKNKEVFARIGSFGHFDAIDALLYLVRNVRKHRNPFPTGRTYKFDDWVITPGQKPITRNARVITNILKTPFRKD